MSWPRMGGPGKREGGMFSSPSTTFVLVVSIALIASDSLAVDAQADGEANCLFNPQVTSCDNNKLKYSVVLDTKYGEKFIINHSIERIPPTKPTKKPRRTLRPRVGPNGETVRMFPALWRDKVAAWKEQMRLLIAKRRAKMRRQRTRITNRNNAPEA